MDFEGFQSQIHQSCGLNPGQLIVVGFSGGTDSLCLLDLLAHCGYPLIAAHLNHHLRPESDGEVAQIQALAAKIGVEVHNGTADVRAIVRERHCTVEEAARIARYTFLFSLARQRGAQAVAVGHTGDDQAETVLMHLLRGSGIAGLSGMRWRSLQEGWDASIPLVRPLMNWSREDTAAYCAGHGLSPIEDPSNQDVTFFRNRLRHELLPYLGTYNPQIKQVLRRSAEVLAGDADLLDEVTESAWQNCQVESGPGYVTFPRTKLLGLPRGLLRRILRRAISTLRPTLRDIDFASIERGVDFILSPTQTHQLDLQSHLRLALENDRLVLAEWGSQVLQANCPQLGSPGQLMLPVPGIVELNAGWRLSAEILPPNVEIQDDPLAAWLDADRTGPQLYIRPRLPGDRFQPLGMDAGTLKVSDFMVNEHLPRSARARWPLVCASDQIIWLAGYRPAHFCRVTEFTRRVLKLQLHPPAGATSG